MCVSAYNDSYHKDVMLPPTTDLEIQKWVERHFGFRPEVDWIAHCKRLCDLPIEDVRAFQKSRFCLCPEHRQPAIKQAFRYFGML